MNYDPRTSSVRHVLAAILLSTVAVQAQEPPAKAEAAPLESVSPEDRREPKVYDLGALVTADERGAPPEVESMSGVGTFARLISAFVQPSLAQNESVKTMGERWLAVLGRPEQHAWIERFLREASSQEKQTWTTSCRLVTVPEVTFQRDIAPALRSPDDASATPASVVLEPGTETEAFRSALREHPKAIVLETPDVTLRSLSPASISVINQTPYVRDYDVEVADAAFVANPIVDVVRDGVMVQASALQLEGGALGLSVDAQVLDLQQPIPTFETTLGVGNPITIQLPQVLSTEISTTVELPEKHALLLALPPLAGKRYLLVVEVRQGAEAAQPGASTERKRRD